MNRFKPLQTQYVQGFFEPERATSLFEHLRTTVSWEDGIRSRKGFTRKAKPLDIEENKRVHDFILEAVQNICSHDYAILGVYLNYYVDGNMWTPSHSHPKQHQIVISLGATRKLIVGKKTFNMSNGDIILFGGSAHEVPKEPEIKDGRISIATFMVPI